MLSACLRLEHTRKGAAPTSALGEVCGWVVGACVGSYRSRWRVNPGGGGESSSGRGGGSYSGGCRGSRRREAFIVPGDDARSQWRRGVRGRGPAHGPCLQQLLPGNPLLGLGARPVPAAAAHLGTRCRGLGARPVPAAAAHLGTRCRGLGARPASLEGAARGRSPPTSGWQKNTGKSPPYFSPITVPVSPYLWPVALAPGVGRQGSTQLSAVSTAIDRAYGVRGTLGTGRKGDMGSCSLHSVKSTVPISPYSRHLHVAHLAPGTSPTSDPWRTRCA